MLNTKDDPCQVSFGRGDISAIWFSPVCRNSRAWDTKSTVRIFISSPAGRITPLSALQRLGLKTAWPCRFGTDPFSQYVKEHALAEGLAPDYFTETDEPSLRITVAFSMDSERAFLSYSDPVPPEPLKDWLESLQPDWLCVSHLAHGESYLDLFRAAHAIGTQVFMDCQAHKPYPGGRGHPRRLEAGGCVRPQRGRGAPLDRPIGL